MIDKPPDIVHTDESALEPSAHVDGPYCRTTIGVSMAKTQDGFKGRGIFDTRGTSPAPAAVALGLGLAVGLILAVAGGVLAGGGLALLCATTPWHMPAWLSFALPLAGAGATTVGIAGAVRRHFRSVRR